MIKTPILELDGGKYGWRSADYNERPWDDTDGWWFCKDTLDDIFIIPKTATRLQLTFHAKPADDRLKVELTNPFKHLCGYHARIEALDFSVGLDTSIWARIEELADDRMVWYMTCYYWEDEC